MPRKTVNANRRSFEEGLALLEELTEKIEQESLPLQEMLLVYEEGKKLSTQLRLELEKAQAQMQEIKLGEDVSENPVATFVEEHPFFDEE